MGELSEWLHSHSEFNGDNDPFVLDYGHSNINDDEPNFQYVMSTPKLLETALNFRILAADGTYKVNEHDYPLIVVGGIDLNQRFHILAYSVTTKEESRNYKFLFQAMKNNIWILFHKKWTPEIIVSDAAGAISNGFRDAFPESDKKYVMCWFHVTKTINQKLAKSENRVALQNDVGAMHLAHSPEVFARYVELFLAKWSPTEPQFWVKMHPGWYLGYAEKCPSTNNGAEGHNSALKRNNTHRELLPLGALNDELGRNLANRSSNDVPVPENITINNDLWISANHWYNGEAKSISVAANTYISSAKSVSKLTRQAIANYDGLIANNFDDFYNLMTSMWALKFDHLDWENSTCTCPKWTGHGICKHVIGTAIALGLVSVPSNLNPAKLRQSSKRIPQVKAAKALTRQPHFHQVQIQPSTSLVARSDSEPVPTSNVQQILARPISQPIGTSNDHQIQPSTLLVTRSNLRPLPSSNVFTFHAALPSQPTSKRPHAAPTSLVARSNSQPLPTSNVEQILARSNSQPIGVSNDHRIQPSTLPTSNVYTMHAALPSQPTSKRPHAAPPSPPTTKQMNVVLPMPPTSKRTRPLQPSPPKSKRLRATPSSPTKTNQTRAVLLTPPRTKRTHAVQPSPPKSKRARTVQPSQPKTEQIQNKLTHLPPHTLLAFGDFSQKRSSSVQYMCANMIWSTLPPIGTAKTTVANASFTHIGKNRIVQSGGVERQHLKRVLFFTIRFDFQIFNIFNYFYYSGH